MLDLLPIELKIKLFGIGGPNPYFKLRYANKEFFKLHNDLVKLEVSKLIDIRNINTAIFKQYQETLRFYNGTLNDLLTPDLNWSLVLSLFRNRKIYFELGDCIIQKFHSPTSSPPRNGTLYQPSFEVKDGTLKLNNVQAFYYHKSISIPKGTYSLQVGITNHKHSRGLGTTTFQVGDYSKSYPTTFLNELIPEGTLAIINLSKFDVVDEVETITIVIEEVGMYPKVDLEFCFIQFTPFTEFENIKDDYMFYTVPDAQINRLEKLAYMNLQGVSIVPERKIDYEWYEEFYRNGERSVKMLYPTDQRYFKEKRMRDSIIPWKVPF